METTDITKLSSVLRFILSFVVILFTLGWFVTLFWKIIPPDNKDVINFASGIILGQGWVKIVSWWFPSDISSEHKTDLLYNSTPNVSLETPGTQTESKTEKTIKTDTPLT
jgi:hypothetical protein